MRKLFIPLLIVVMFLMPMTVAAQGDEGEGGIVVEGNFSGSVNFGALNPLRANDSATNRIANLMFPYVVYGSAFTQTYGKANEEGVSNALATDWTISEDGKVYTFKLRDDAFWSDGTPITSLDVKFSFDAIASGDADSPYYGTVNYIPDGNPTGIKEIRIIDDYTFEAVFEQPTCIALVNIGAFNIVPAHAFGYTGQEDFDFTTLIDHEFDTNPSVVYGPFDLGIFNPGEAIGLESVDTWAEGAVLPDGYIYRDVPDQTVEAEQFMAGELNFIDNPQISRRAEMREDPDLTMGDFPGNAWDYMLFNVADPENPQPGMDENGNLIDQGHHPIFADPRVRVALQHAINIDEIIQGAVFGEGTQMPSSLIPTSWAFSKDLAPLAYDPELAGKLLDEAGWPLGSDGVRICQGCLYAEEGTPFEFELLTNAGNTRREAIGVIIQDQLYELGINVDFQAIDWQLLLDQTQGAQTFDAAIMGWREGFPSDPDQLQLFNPSNDDPANQGSNAGSYYNPEFIRLAVEAASVPGCVESERAEVYHEIQKLLQEDPPYMWLFVQNLQYGANTNVENFDPYPNVPLWNVKTWRVPTP